MVRYQRRLPFRNTLSPKNGKTSLTKVALIPHKTKVSTDVQRFLLSKNDNGSKKNAYLKKIGMEHDRTNSTKINNASSLCMITRVPVDVMKDIFKHLCYKEIVKNMAVVCKLFRDAANHELLWQHIYQQTYPSASRRAGDPWRLLFVCRKTEEKRQQYSKLPLDLAEQFIFMDSAFEVMKEQKKCQDAKHSAAQVSETIFTSSRFSSVGSELDSVYFGSLSSCQTLSLMVTSQQSCSTSCSSINLLATKPENELRKQMIESYPTLAVNSSVTLGTSEALNLAKQELFKSKSVRENSAIHKRKYEQLEKNDILVKKDLISTLLVFNGGEANLIKNYSDGNVQQSNCLFSSDSVFPAAAVLQNSVIINDNEKMHGGAPPNNYGYSATHSLTATPPYSPLSDFSCSLLSEHSAYHNVREWDNCYNTAPPTHKLDEKFSTVMENKDKVNHNALNSFVSSSLLRKDVNCDTLFCFSNSTSTIPTPTRLVYSNSATFSKYIYSQPAFCSSSTSMYSVDYMSCPPLFSSSCLVPCVKNIPTVETCLAEWEAKHPEIVSLSSTETNVSHICSGQRCTFTVSPSLNLYICNKTGKHHICGGHSSCDRAFPSDQDLGFLVCPVTGRMFDCLSTVCAKQEKTYGGGRTLNVPSNYMDESSFESEAQQYMNLFMAEKQQEENDREEAAARGDGDDEELTWGLPGFLGQCWTAGYNNAAVSESWRGCRSKRRKRRYIS